MQIAKRKPDGESRLFPATEFFDRDFFPAFFSRPMNEPAVNVIENSDNFRIELAAPGMKKEDFKIRVDGNLLEISAERKEEKEEKEENYTRREFSQSSFSRTFTLPDTINADKIGADYRDGLLKLTLPKKDEAKKREPKQIPIS